MVSNERSGEGSKKIDLEKVAQLVDALERDLAKVRSGSRDVQLLRDEVETLKNVLNSPIRRPHWVREGLHGMRRAIEAGLDTAVADGLKAGQYIAISRRSEEFWECEPALVMTKMSPLDPPTGIRPEEFGAGILVNGVLRPFDAGRKSGLHVCRLRYGSSGVLTAPPRSVGGRAPWRRPCPAITRCAV